MFNTKSKIEVPKALADARERREKLGRRRIQLEEEALKLRREGAQERTEEPEGRRERIAALLPEGLAVALQAPPATGKRRLAAVGEELEAVLVAEGIERGEVERLAGEASLAAGERLRPEVAQSVVECLDALRRFLKSQEALHAIHARLAEAGLSVPDFLRCEHWPLYRAVTVDARNIEEAARRKGLIE